MKLEPGISDRVERVVVTPTGEAVKHAVYKLERGRRLHVWTPAEDDIVVAVGCRSVHFTRDEALAIAADLLAAADGDISAGPPVVIPIPVEPPTQDAA